MPNKVSPKSIPQENFQEIVGALQIAFEDQFRNYLYSRKNTLNYGELFDPLIDDLIEYATRPAKRVRPLLFLLSYKYFNPKPLTVDEIIRDDSIMKGAMAIELLHAFILIHDDVIDRSELRRNLPTYHKLVEERLGNCSGRARAGENVSIVFGDIVFALAVETFSQNGISSPAQQKGLQKFLKYSCDTGAGEILDILLSIKDISRVKEEEILRTYHLKTTRYTFECPLVLGATLAGAGEDVCEELSRISNPLGLAFQIENDLQEFEIEERSFQSDLLESKKTLLIRKAYDAASEEEKAFIRSCFETPLLKDSVLFKLHELILKTGAYHSLRIQTRELFDQSARALASADFTPTQKAVFSEYIAFMRKQFQKQSRQNTSFAKTISSVKE
ncbi:polyprenyl synthetase family protein [Oscillatoria laete-virens NRMC-F 0139]|nr:polyprenyl synthetase family protein [Oscillatoria laete-virens]MDL5054471.1 polyprenyl synthetase family protein [Oscillatoria laete-virens NRMC-F 0139]